MSHILPLVPSYQRNLGILKGTPMIDSVLPMGSDNHPFINDDSLIVSIVQCKLERCWSDDMQWEDRGERREGKVETREIKGAVKT